MSMALSSGSITYVRQTADKLVSKRFNACLLHKLFLRLKVRVLPFGADKAKLNICVDGVVEETGLLLHKANLGPPPLEVNLPQGASADRDGTVAPMETLK